MQGTPIGSTPAHRPAPLPSAADGAKDQGMEDQLGALGLALNAVVLFNSLYIDAAVKQLAADGFPVTDDLLARLSPLQYDHIDFLGRYVFTRPPAPGLRALRDPHTDDGTDDAEDG
ncbi:transposase [Streptomyces europaeiscabiei]|uniref:transposase n=1 Tax=Streptomyces TaxID=1883 RepID=UPI00211AAE27|nr:MULTISPECIES: transposase [Streptomyces]MDX3637411.1 Tn3 family transposase [Streptomyces europaeiscabiei]